jgi:TetR/AcrR family transcriptional repressor of nem operon
MARPREFDPDDVLQTAIELFWEKGYYNSSVDEVVRQSGVAKYGIYGVFGSKRELFKKALTQYAIDRHSDMQCVIRKPGAALPEILTFFKEAVTRMTRQNTKRGCLMVNTGVELGLRDAEIRDVVTDFFQDTEEVMARCLANAVEQGQLVDVSSVPALAAFLVNEFRAALMLAASGSPRRSIQAHLDMALRVLS